jgi:hypothetical protein
MDLYLNPYINQVISHGKGGEKSYKGYFGDLVARLGKGAWKEAISSV